MRARLFLTLFFLATAGHASFAQKKSRAKENRVVMVAGKPMTSIDSLMVKQLFLSAIREKTIGNYPKAGEYFARALDIDPQNDASMYELSNIYHLGRNDAKALQLMERAVTVRPENQWYWQSLARMYDFNTDWDKSAQAYAELIRINPNREEFYAGRADAFFKLKKYDDALAVYRQLEQKTGLTPELVSARQKIYLKTDNTRQAVADLRSFIARNPNEIRYYLLLAEVYNAKGEKEQAVKVLNEAKAIDPGSAYVQLALADVNRDLRNGDASFTAIKTAFGSNDLDLQEKLRILGAYSPKTQDATTRARMAELAKTLTIAHPADSRAWAAYGEMLMQNTRTKEAKTAFRKALELNEQLYPVWEQLVRLSFTENDFSAVVKDGEEALSLFPNQSLMNFFVGIGHAQKKDHQKAIGYFKNTVALQVQDKNLLAQVYANLGDSYHALKDDKRSDEAYEKALSYDPDNTFTLNNYAYYLSLRGENLAGAEKMSKRSNELKPGTASYEDTYAWILFRLKKYGEARLWMEKAMQHNGGTSGTQLEHYGDILYHLGDSAGAVEKWKAAKSRGNASPRLEKKINEKKYVE